MTPDVAVRRAGADDAEELVRLRLVMMESVDGTAPPPGDWSRNAAASLRRRLPLPDAPIAAFVVDRPSPPGLVACAVGVFEERLASPVNPNGLAGYVFNVATDPQYRRRGYSTACMRALLAWFAAHDVAVVNLRASDDGLPVYERLGFELQPGPAMRLRLG
ncbi:GNAT family N-acetyltransferase [Dactylosporangium sucinum]|uniref:N-acetyltransferase n=1 Tax=Dactylosporangium sucinum TaxID=1424081 RepID=A0A917T4B4_9ACTN|nr:GNAT family N-acetyltransferase [Dactylosporangium sucinum]GGM07831.1 N-acetyltransferase [Dactylosporangium sucinum]